jgi:hypothetical protein
MELVSAMDGLPLAIELMAKRVLDQPDRKLSHHLQQWMMSHTAGLGSSVPSRLTSLDSSLELSYNSPRMIADARNLLAILSLLPEGLPIDEIRNVLPSATEDPSWPLLKTSFGFQQNERIKLLGPTRSFILRKQTRTPIVPCGVKPTVCIVLVPFTLRKMTRFLILRNKVQ